MKQLFEYSVALTNLYGIVTFDKVAEIYNEQNKDQISLVDVRQIAANEKNTLENEFVYTKGEEFMHQAVLEREDQLRKEKENKPYYVPEKEELLRYTDHLYFEKNREYKALEKFLNKEVFKKQPDRAEDVATEMYDMIHAGADTQTMFSRMTMMGVAFKNQDQVNRVMQLVMDLNNNVRLWENNGHTPMEIHERFEKPNLKPLPDELAAKRSSMKAGRNDPCPCGSGKKYKKCCMG